jgi:hypothetical protein
MVSRRPYTITCNRPTAEISSEARIARALLRIIARESPVSRDTVMRGELKTDPASCYSRTLQVGPTWVVVRDDELGQFRFEIVWADKDIGIDGSK